MTQILHESCDSAQAPVHTLRIPRHKSRGYHSCMDKKDALLRYRLEMGKRLAEARVKAKMTQADAAAELTKRGHRNKEDGPLEPSRIGNYEQGLRMPDPVLVKDLCEIYDEFPSKIYGFDEAPQNKEEASLTIKYRHTDDRGKKAVQGIADAQPAYGVTADDEGTKEAG